jgi:hypothetical protein
MANNADVTAVVVVLFTRAIDQSSSSGRPQ